MLKRVDTNKLTGNRLEIAHKRHPLRLLLIWLAMVAAVLVAWLGVRYLQARFQPTGRLEAAIAENASLKLELDRTKLQMTMERATRGELEKQVAKLNDEVRKLRADLNFYKQAEKPSR